MNEGTPWSYEADYYGLATIIHTLLFEVILKSKDGSKIKLHANFKRYGSMSYGKTCLSCC